MIHDLRDARRAVSATSPVNLAYMASIYTDAPPWKKYEDEGDSEKMVNTKDHELLKKYNAEDCVYTARAWNGVCGEPDWHSPRVRRLYALHTGLSKVAASMYRVGLPIDKKRRKELDDQLLQMFDERAAKLYGLVGVKDFKCNPNSMRALLWKKHETKKIHRFSLPDPEDPNQWVQKKMRTIAVDQKALLLLISNPDCPPDLIPIVDAYWQACGAQKARSTYVSSQKVEEAIGDDGCLRAGWNSCGTDTGRFACSSPNLMNLSEKKDDDGSSIVGSLPNMRSMYWAGPGNVLIGADWSQLELRVMYAVSGDEVLGEALATGDVYSADAQDIFAEQLSDKDVKWIKENAKPQRKSSKITHLAFQYGAGIKTIYQQALEQDRRLKFSFMAAIHRKMLRRYWQTVKYWKDEAARVQECGYSSSRILDRRRVYPRQPPPTETSNFPIQSTASDVANISMLKIYNSLIRNRLKTRIVIQLHDAFYTRGPEREERVVREILHEHMEAERLIEGKKFRFPIEVKSGTHWSDL